jgi:hypothetical protein
LELDKWCLNGWLWNFVYFENLYKKEQISHPKNDLAMRKSSGHISWVLAFCFILWKEDRATRKRLVILIG